MINNQKLVEEFLLLAQDKLEAAQILLQANKWRDASSRAYYSALHAITAVLLTRDLKFSSHAQVLGAFNREFVKTGLFTKRMSKLLRILFKHRQEADYIAHSPFSKEVAAEDVEYAAELLLTCNSYIELAQL